MTLIDKFFSLGPKDPARKLSYDYSLFWVIFLAFIGLAGTYIYNFVVNKQNTAIFWAVIMLIIAYFNYHTLKGMRDALNLAKMLKNAPTIENKEEMIKGF